jgi:hypothetical protein
MRWQGDGESVIKWQFVAGLVTGLLIQGLLNWWSGDVVIELYEQRVKELRGVVTQQELSIRECIDFQEALKGVK